MRRENQHCEVISNIWRSICISCLLMCIFIGKQCYLKIQSQGPIGSTIGQYKVYYCFFQSAPFCNYEPPNLFRQFGMVIVVASTEMPFSTIIYKLLSLKIGIVQCVLKIATQQFQFSSHRNNINCFIALFYLFYF